METNGHDANAVFERLFDAIAMVNINVDVQDTAVVSIQQLSQTFTERQDGIDE